MKAVLLFFYVFLYTVAGQTQVLPASPWIWMKGDNTINSFGQYGTKGTVSATNKPGARNSSATWKDPSGNMWLFGGAGYSKDAQGYLSDLWKYVPATGNWTWVKGDNTTDQPAVYGTQGVAADANKPGATYSPVSWTDASGNLWLFGGFGFTQSSLGLLNTLWKYNTQTNQWTWVKGSNTPDQLGVYGTLGAAAAGNCPGARYGSQSWTDANGNLWLFGGYGYSASAYGLLNDLWKYNPATITWTWIKGDNTAEQKAVYGSKTVAANANKPGARYASSSWVAPDGKVWLFGGYGYDETYSGNLNDMWRYDPQTNQWTWMHGDKIRDQKAVFGTLGQVALTNKPGSRYVSSAWMDHNGDLIMFGGYGFDAVNSGYLNDLWKYNTTNNTWTWVKGDNTVDQRGVYGTQGTANPSNKSGARTGSVSWADGSGNMWMFGGTGYGASGSGDLNDLWKISSNTTVLPLQLLTFDGVLTDDNVLLNWKTADETGFNYFAVQRSRDGNNFSTIGTISGNGGNALTTYKYDDNNISTQQAKAVYYRLQMVDNDKKVSYSKVIRFNLEQTAGTLTTYPNPATNSITVAFEQKRKDVTEISIMDMRGVLVKRNSQLLAAGKINLTTDISALPAGSYLLAVKNSENVLTKKFIKQ